MSKDKTTKYPTLRVRVTQEQFDKAYRMGWPDCVKQFINTTPENQHGKETDSSNTADNQQKMKGKYDGA